MPDMPQQPASGVPNPQPPSGNPPNLLSQQAFVLPGAEPQKAASPMPTPQMPTPQTAAPMAMGDGPKSHKGLVIGLVAFVIIAGAGAYYFFFMAGADEASPSDVVESAEVTEPAVSGETESADLEQATDVADTTGDNAENTVAGEADSADAAQDASESDSAPSNLENSDEEESPLDPEASKDAALIQEQEKAEQSAVQKEPTKELDAPAAEGPSSKPGTSTEDNTAKFFTTGTSAEPESTEQPQSSFAKRKVPRKQ